MRTTHTMLWKAACLLVIASMLMSAVFVFSVTPAAAQTEPPTDPEIVEPVFEDPSEDEVGQAEPETDALLVKAAAEGSVGVIVVLNVPDQPDSTANPQRGEGAQPLYAAAQGALMRTLAGRNITNVHAYNSFPLVAMRVDAAALRALLRHHMVAAVQEDHLNYTSLEESAPLIGSYQAADAGYTGDGTLVAIIDTGVQLNHPFLAGKVVEGGCFSGANGNYPGEVASTCPGGAYYLYGAAASTACTVSTPYNSCQHGTHVAGIAAGNSADLHGVARDADIVAYNVFSYLPGYGAISAFDSDIIMALDDVRYLKVIEGLNITAVNMSLGGGKFTKYCDSVVPATKKAIDALRKVNIATIISSGNDGYIDGISYPGCISSAISVGATDKDDEVADFSNYDSFLSLLAPGVDIYSSVTGSGYEYLNGTSMAAPHVTGAWAVLREAFPTKSVSATLSMLKTTGVPVKDWRNGKTKPRINIAYALGKYTKPSSAPVLTYPADGDNLSDSTPSLGWSTVPLASKYKVVIKRNGTSTAYSKTIKASDYCSDTACSLQIATILKSAMHTWTVQAYSGAGGGPVSAPSTFYTPTVLPAAVVMGEPQGALGYNQPKFTWSFASAPYADKFYLKVYKDGKSFVSKTYEATKVCSGSTCSVPAPKTLTEGAYTWEIKPWNPLGYGPVTSASFSFALANGYSNSFDSDTRGLSFAYPAWNGGDWWLNSSRLVTWYGANYTWASANIQGTFKSVDVTAVMNRSGDTYAANGIIIRGTPTLQAGWKDWKAGYEFLFSQNGKFSIWKLYNNREYMIQDWTPTAAINNAGYNTLRVRADGQDMYFFINGTLVWSGRERVAGPDLTSGSIGVKSYVEVWLSDYLYVDSLTTYVPATPLSIEEATISAEQLALNEAALAASPMGSPAGPHISMEEYEFLSTFSDPASLTFEQKLQACIAAGHEFCPALPE